MECHSVKGSDDVTLSEKAPYGPACSSHRIYDCAYIADEHKSGEDAYYKAFVMSVLCQPGLVDIENQIYHCIYVPRPNVLGRCPYPFL